MKYRGGEKTLALFIDYENLALGVTGGRRLDMKLIHERLLEKGRVIAKRAYCDWGRFKEEKKKLHELAIDLIEVPQRRQGGKNSADIRMVVDAMEMCYEKQHLDIFVVASGDSDFSPLVNKLRESNKEVIGIGVKGSTSNLLVEVCDEFIFYEDLLRHTERRSKKKQPSTMPKRLANLSEKKLEVVTRLLNAVDALNRENKDVLWGSMVKQTVKRRHPSFDESYYGFSNFSKLLEEMQTLKIFKLKRDEASGGYIVVAVADDVL